MAPLIFMGAALVITQLGLALYGRPVMAVAAGGLAGGSFLAAAILGRAAWLIVLSAVTVIVALLAWFWRGPRGRRRARDAIGEESREIRDGLVRKMRDRGATRPGAPPQPSR